MGQFLWSFPCRHGRREWLPPLPTLLSCGCRVERSPEPPLLKTQQTQLPQPFPTRQVFQRFTSLVAFCWMCSRVSMSLLRRGAQDWRHRLAVLSTGGEHCPGPAGCIILDPGQGAIGPPGHCAHCWLMLSNSTPKSLSIKQLLISLINLEVKAAHCIVKKPVRGVHCNSCIHTSTLTHGTVYKLPSSRVALARDFH